MSELLPAGRHHIADNLAQLVVNYDARHFPPRGAIVERKHDGIRALWLGGQLVTRNGVVIWCSAHLWPALARLERALGGPHLIDAEYVEPGGFADTARRFSATMHAGRPMPGHGIAWCFDAVPLGVWRGERPGDALWQRKLRLRDALDDAGEALRYVDDVRVGDGAQALALAAAAYDRGEEGVVIKDPYSTHRAGRSRAWQRLKRSMTVDLRVIGHAPRTNDPDTLGAVICEYAGRAVRVSAGFDDRDRAILYHHPDRLVGRIAEIGAMEATETGSLRSPRFLRWRVDKEIGL